MAIHEIEVTLTGKFFIDDDELESSYDAETPEEAIANQYNWLEDSGDMMQFVADTIEEPKLKMRVVGSTPTNVSVRDSVS